MRAMQGAIRRFQMIASILPLPLSMVDLRGLPEAEREARAQRPAIEEAQQPFNDLDLN
jgi:hypothetical protein